MDSSRWLRLAGEDGRRPANETERDGTGTIGDHRSLDHRSTETIVLRLTAINKSRFEVSPHSSHLPSVADWNVQGLDFFLSHVAPGSSSAVNRFLATFNWYQTQEKVEPQNSVPIHQSAAELTCPSSYLSP